MSHANFPQPTAILKNPAYDADLVYPEALQSVLNLERARQSLTEIQSWPGYQVTPLQSLAGIAHALGVADVYYKDEGGRFGIGSFKALGGAYAVLRTLKKHIKETTGTSPSTEDILAGVYRNLAAQLTVTTATDGNHGRSVAWGARLFGCACTVFIHRTVSEGRKHAIEHYGAHVVRTDGNYDDAVRQADESARLNGWALISDTSYEGYDDIPKDVMQGYTVMVQEVIDQLPDSHWPSHVFVQGGVGALAAAVCAHIWESRPLQRPRFVVVEPDRAACLYESAKHGKPVVIHGELDTMMAGLACGEISKLAWMILEKGARDFVTLPDEAAIEAMRCLARGAFGDAPIVAGESAVAGLAVLLAAISQPPLRHTLGLTADSRVLLFGTEGATDPALYERIVSVQSSRLEGDSHPCPA
ncbi:MAG: diaminopropionate ammonia-lyase [Myxococcales bacterium]|nr:diaminopropionate ammonia-lyase [Myxococcales bacterium]MCB9709479.1 diaminopropionate ammonia-lyase [Myxococcales bacterium]